MEAALDLGPLEGKISLFLRIEADGALLYSRATRAYVRPSAAETFLMVASREVGLEAALSDLEAAVGRAEAEAALASLEALAAFDREGRFAGQVLELEAVPGAFGAPLVAHLGVTLACNFSCSHCYSSSGRKAPNELSLSEICAIIDQLVEIGCHKLVLGGGEPFIRKDLAAIVAYADDRGVDCFVHTNGSLLDSKILDALARQPPAGLSVSLDGPDAETNDIVRGKGAFSRTTLGIERLRRSYPHGFNLSVTITPTNAAETPRLVELASELGARVLLLRPAYPAGEALSNQALVADRDTFAHAIDLARPRAAELGLELDAPHPYEAIEPDFEGYGCVAARVVLGITPTGDVTPCLNLPGQLVSGNVRTDRLADLWKRGSGFDALRAIEPNEQCSSCKHYDVCRGGCRVRALFAGNGLEGPDSWCHYEPRDGVEAKTFAPAERRARLRVI